MARQEGDADASDLERSADDVIKQEALADQAVQLGCQHRDAETAPFGDADYVYWDEGSSRLLSALGIDSPTTSDNVGWRERLVRAYCDALEPAEADDVEPGW
jgi:hypothetical protein